MIYLASELLAKLRNLALCGQNAEGELEWIGTSKQWESSENEAMAILREQDELDLERTGDLEELAKDSYFDR